MPESDEQAQELENQPAQAMSEENSSQSSGDISIQIEEGQADEEAASGDVDSVIQTIERRISQKSQMSF